MSGTAAKRVDRTSESAQSCAGATLHDHDCFYGGALRVLLHVVQDVDTSTASFSFNIFLVDFMDKHFSVRRDHGKLQWCSLSRAPR